MKRLLEAPDVSRVNGVRDRAILEVFYSAALRLSELARLEVRDVDFGRGLVAVRAGKGGKSRMAPLGEEAVGWLRRYLREARPRWSGRCDTLFLGQTGLPLSPHWLQVKIRRLGQKAGIDKPVTAHTLRRTCATHLLASGASPWAVKELLGHADLSTLGRYVSLSLHDLRKVHEETHPRGR
jgi:integrase/recombinase XerD